MGASILTAKNLSKVVPSAEGELTILHELSLELNKGDSLAIVGASGSGKSTLLGLLAGLDLPSSGEVTLAGQGLSTLDEDQRARIRAEHVGFVFQSFHLLHTRTVLENVMLATAYAGVPRQDRERLAHGALARVDMSHRTDFYPGTLSGGEKQRVAIARAVSTSPRLLLADEPTGNLDQTNSQGVMALFEELSEDGLTIVMITHDPVVAKSARRRASIHDGRLTELD